MKKIVILIILLFGLTPCFKNGFLTIKIASTVNAQTLGQEEGDNGKIPELPIEGGNPYPPGEGAGPVSGGLEASICAGLKDTYNNSFKADGSKKEQSGYLVDDKNGGTMFIANSDANHTDSSTNDMTYSYSNDPKKYAKANNQYYH